MSSASSSSSERSSSSPEPISTVLKKKGKVNAAANGKGPRNEGTEDPTWAFKPPPGRTLVNSLGDAGEFDWDAVNNDDDVEIWVIRAPSAVKPKHLSSLQIDPPSSSKTLKVGTLKKKHAAFDIWSIGKEITDETPVGGEEINTLSCLLPRSKKGKVYHAPKPIARRLVLSAQPVSPTQAEPQTLPDRDPSTQKYKNPPRPSYPNELLKHAFKPYGSNTTTVNGDTREEEDGSMDVDVNAQTPSTKPTTKTDAKPDPEPKKSKDKEKKGKKRKVASDETTVEEDAAPKKKSKKSKSSS